MNLILLFVTIMFVSQTTKASTFVGNGGNFGDVELQVAKRQVIESLNFILNNPDKNSTLCTCHRELEGHGVCEVLKSLNDEKREFCKKFILEQASKILSLVANEGQIKMDWTHDKITVVEGELSRASDAVTNLKSMSVVLNQERFIEMKSYERIFLLGHEFVHLTEYKGSPIKDEMSIGPFDSKDGGRQLLNSVGAALSMVSADAGIISRYQSPLKRSRARSKNWINFSGSKADAEGADKSVFLLSDFSENVFEYRYDAFENIGFFIQFIHMEKSKGILSSIKASEKRSLSEIGVSYKLTPFADPLSFLGQSHFLFKLGVLKAASEYRLQDSALDESSSSGSQGFATSISYFMPLSNGFWIFLNFGYRNYNTAYEFKDAETKIEYDSNQKFQSIGVSYGF